MRHQDQQVTIRVSAALLHRIKRAAEINRTSKSAFIKQCLIAYLRYLEAVDTKKEQSRSDRP